MEAATAPRPAHALAALVEPHPSIHDEATRRRARILAAGMLTLGTLGILASLLGPITIGGRPADTATTQHGLAAGTMAIAAYGLARSPYWRVGAGAAIVSVGYGTWASIILAEGPTEQVATVFFIALPIMLSGALLSRSWATTVGLANLALVAGLPGLFPSDPATGRTIAAIFIVLVTALVLILSAIWRGDLAEIERHRNDLERRQARLNAILTNTPDSVLLVERTGRIVFLNHAKAGRNVDDIVGTNVHDWLAPEERGKLQTALDEAFAGRQTAIDEVTVNLAPVAPGTERWAFRVVSPHQVGDPDGPALVVAQDVTERQKIEHERVAARMHAQELTQLKTMNDFKSSFINMAAHELNTPMTPLLLSTVMLRRSIDSPLDAAKHLASVERNVDRLRDLLDDVLEAARLQSFQIPIAPRAYDLRDTADDAVAAYQAAAAAADLNLHVETPPDPVPVNADPRRMDQVMRNLIDNAIKYSGPGGNITVRVPSPTSQRTAAIEVQDTGRGLDADQQAGIFEPFERVHPDIRQGPPGTGLGLYLVRGIMEQQNGSIECHSPGRGRGATFRAHVPRADAPIPGSADRPQPRAPFEADDSPIPLGTR